MSPRIGLDLHSILQAASEIADTSGIEDVTMATLAKKLDIRSPSLYNHIDGLQGLRTKLAIYGIQQLSAVLARASIGLSGDDAVRALAGAYVSFARTHPGLYEATLRAPDPRDPEFQQAAAEVVDLVARILRVYGLEDEAAIHAVRGIRSMLHGFASLEQRGQFGIPLDPDASLHRLIDTYLVGLRTMKRTRSES